MTRRKSVSKIKTRDHRNYSLKNLLTNGIKENMGKKRALSERKKPKS